MLLRIYEEGFFLLLRIYEEGFWTEIPFGWGGWGDGEVGVAAMK